MIRINANNKRTIELSKIERSSLIYVDVVDSSGEVEYYYLIDEAEIVTMLNEFEEKNNIR